MRNCLILSEIAKYMMAKAFVYNIFAIHKFITNETPGWAHNKWSYLVGVFLKQKRICHGSSEARP